MEAHLSKIAIRTEGLTRDFGKLRAINSLSLEVAAGTVFGFLGPNGAGKTTTIRLLLGLLESTAGRAEVLGFDTREQADEVRRHTGALLEHSGLYERLTAEENLEFYGRVWRLIPSERRARIKELLLHLDLWERRKEPVGTWSTGMRKRLDLARALLHRPSLVFLDEPTAGLDPMGAAAVREDLSTLAAREGVTVFLTTHNLTEAEKLCGKVGVIREGKLVATGSPQDLQAGRDATRVDIIGHGFAEEVLASLRDRPEVLTAELRDDRLLLELRMEARTAPLVTLLVGAGVQVEEVRREKASLEEVFLALMREEKE